jgi:hypothetical protein
LHVEFKRRKRNGIKRLSLRLSLRRLAKESFKTAKIATFFERSTQSKRPELGADRGDHDALHRDSWPSSAF